MRSNDDVALTPVTDVEGPTIQIAVPGLRIGVAEYAEGPTGCTVFVFDDGGLVVSDPRGGLVGMVDTPGWCDAICFAGGSLLGLEAVAGVAAEVFARDGHDPFGGLPLVNGAILFDYNRPNAIYPDKELGRAAVRAATDDRLPVGRRGAGVSATVAKTFDFTQAVPGGQGGAVRTVGEATFGVVTVVNAVGAVLDRDGSVVAGGAVPAAELDRRLAAGEPVDAFDGGNTTLTIVVTDAMVDEPELRQLGREVHSSMARAIQPFHTRNDGDVLFTVCVPRVETELSVAAMGLLCSELAWDAVLSAVRPS